AVAGGHGGRQQQEQQAREDRASHAGHLAAPPGAWQLLRREANRMTICIHLPEPARGRVVVASSPLLETLLSLNALDARAGALPARRARGLRELRFCFHGSIPDVAAARPGGARPTLRDELERLADEPAETLGLAFLRPLYDHGGAASADVLGDPAVRLHALR